MMKQILKNEFSIALVAAILFIPFLGNVHLFDWDEINFAESAREMMASGNYFSVQINFTRFTEKPPLFFWMQVLSMKVLHIDSSILGVVSVSRQLSQAIVDQLQTKHTDLAVDYLKKAIKLRNHR